MTYQELGALMDDVDFRGRIKVAHLQYVQYVFNENPSDPNTPPGHTSRYRWAQQAAQTPDVMAAQLQPLVVMDAAVRESGSAIADAALQSAVEGVISKLF
jgi:hypothetical protein